MRKPISYETWLKRAIKSCRESQSRRAELRVGGLDSEELFEYWKVKGMVWAYEHALEVYNDESISH